MHVKKFPYSNIKILPPAGVLLLAFVFFKITSSVIRLVSRCCEVLLGVLLFFEKVVF